MQKMQTSSAAWRYAHQQHKARQAFARLNGYCYIIFISDDWLGWEVRLFTDDRVVYRNLSKRATQRFCQLHGLQWTMAV